MDWEALYEPLQLPCGAVLKNRLIKAAMSDSLGDGAGNPTGPQARLYERWAEGGVAAAIIGEVQGTPDYPENSGNLVLDASSDMDKFSSLATRGSVDTTHLWLQLGHAGAMSHNAISSPRGPSSLTLPKLTSSAFTESEIDKIPEQFATTAALAERLGFGGVQVHAAHGFLLSQFLSPLFNRRSDDYGGSIEGRMRLLLNVVAKIRNSVSPSFPLAVKINATDQLEGGLHESDSLEVITALDEMQVDVIEISGGTYFPGAKPASDSGGSGPYFLDFMKRARTRTDKPLMLTGGIKSRSQALAALLEGADLIGLARALVLEPELPKTWSFNVSTDPVFPAFVSPPEGGVTAWYTMRLAQIGEGRIVNGMGVNEAVEAYALRDRMREKVWTKSFG